MTEASIQVAPAPWKLKGRSWIFLLSGLPTKSASFPAGWAADYMAEALASGGEFIGGPGMVQLVSYSESPVGPYDELIYIPGRWKYGDGTAGFRITRIYVSSKESTYNGRKNWDICKQLASFNYTKNATTGVWSLAVSDPASPDKPFFKATVRPISLVSSISFPYNTKLLGKYFTLVNPPLPHGPTEEEVGTDKWAALIPVLTGKAKLVKVEVGLDPADGTTKKRLADGVGFPNVQPWSAAVLVEDLDIDFGEATWKESFDK